MGAIMGYYVGRARFHSNERMRAHRMAYVIPTVLHGLYDYPILTLETLRERGLQPEDGVRLLPITLAAFVTTCLWALRSVRRARADQAAATPPSHIFQARHDRFWIAGTILLFLGLVFAIGGGIVLSRAVTATTSERRQLVETAIVGILPLCLGLGLFGLGIRSLNRSSIPVLGPPNHSN
jgi:hypothetical protein